MRRAVLLAALLAVAACSTKHVTLGGKLKTHPTAEENYRAGVELAKKESWPEAQQFFDYVKTKFPFSKEAALADLRLADLKFDQHLWAEAVEAYSRFVQLHPSHDEVDYAEFRMAQSFFKDAPGEFFLFPPAHEKDNRQTERAANALAAFVEKYPKSKYAPEAKKLLDEANGRLARLEAQALGGRRRPLRDARREVPGLAARARGPHEARRGGGEARREAPRPHRAAEAHRPSPRRPAARRGGEAPCLAPLRGRRRRRGRCASPPSRSRSSRGRRRSGRARSGSGSPPR
jgi:outer membrane assembly lipoprotein YfiO